MKEMNEQQALARLCTLCSQAEHCTGEAIDKLQRWGIEGEAQDRILAYLLRERYIDDSRYCRFFIHDKLCYNGWGRRKIEQALYAKKIGKDISNPLFEELETAQYLEVLRPLINQKWKTVKARDDYERATKVIRFAMGRGFSYDQIRTCIDELSDEDHGEYSDPHF